MELVSPDIGLIFWVSVIFVLLFFALRKLAWPHILSAIKSREDMIRSAISSAEKNQEEIAKLKDKNESLLKEAIEQRNKILAEAKDTANKIISIAEEKANKQAKDILISAQDSIRQEKDKMLEEIRVHAIDLSISIAEKLLKRELKKDKSQEEFVKDLLK